MSIVSDPITPLTPYTAPYSPISNITPFTYRDGETYLRVLERLRCYLTDTIIPYVDENFALLGNEFVVQVNTMIDTVNAQLAAQTTAVDNALADQSATVTQDIADLTTYVNAQVQAIITAGITVSDPVVYGILNNTASTSRILLDQIVDLDVDKSHYLGLLAPIATGSDQSAALQAAAVSAAAAGLWLVLNGDHIVNNPITLPAGIRIDGRSGTIRQTGALKTLFIVNNVNDVRFHHVRAFGLKTDYVNTSSVYAATAVYITGTSSNITVDGCKFVDFAGAGIYVTGTASNIHVRNSTMSGAGSAYILGTTYNYSGGFVTDNGITNWSVKDCDISAYAQGIVTGDNLTDVRITGNFIHDIPGQHGIYLESVDGCVISNNIIKRTALLGMKVQIGLTTAIDPVGIVIANNVFDTLGSQGILLTNAVGGTPRGRRVIVTGNTINNAAGVAIEVNNVIDISITNNIIENSKTGLRIASCSEITISNMRIKTTQQSGIYLSSATDVTVDNVRIINPASAKVVSDMFGILIDGTSADIVINRVKISDTLANMKYGVYLSAGDSTTMAFSYVTVAGATDYGWRMTAAANVLAFIGNVFVGTIAAFLNAPSNYAQQADTSGATLANLEIEVNKLKAVLRANGLIRT